MFLENLYLVLIGWSEYLYRVRKNFENSFLEGISRDCLVILVIYRKRVYVFVFLCVYYVYVCWEVGLMQKC